jgi:hypothetical protein
LLPAPAAPPTEIERTRAAQSAAADRTARGRRDVTLQVFMRLLMRIVDDPATLLRNLAVRAGEGVGLGRNHPVRLQVA